MKEQLPTTIEKARRTLAELDVTRTAIEEVSYREALEKNGYRLSAAARLLDLRPATFSRRLARLYPEIERERQGRRRFASSGRPPHGFVADEEGPARVALEKSEWVLGRAAKDLGIAPRTLRRIVAAYPGLEEEFVARGRRWGTGEAA